MERKEQIKPIPKSYLERTSDDHIRAGGTPDQVLLDNPGKSLADMMSDAELKANILKQVAHLREQYESALSGNELGRNLVRIGLRMLPSDIEYLRRINRLPEELADFDPEKEFKLPE